MSDADAIADARGEVLAGLAALQGLSDLLHSRRVGVKALARALPEMGVGLADVERAVTTLFAGIEPPLEHAAPVVARVRSLLSSLRTELAAVANLDARRRIGLERDAVAARHELEAALWAGDLAAAVVTRRTLALDLAELLRHTWNEPPRNGETRIQVEVALEEGATFSADPKIAIALLELAISNVHVAGIAEPRVSVRREEGRLVARIGAGEGRAKGLVVMHVPSHDSSPEIVSVALELAGRAGIEIDRDVSGRVFTIVLNSSASAG